LSATTPIARLYAWVLRHLYHEFAWWYDAVAWGVSWGRWGAWRRFAFAYVEGARVLELGSGPGHLLVEGACRGFKVVGIDTSQQMVRLARRRLTSLADNGWRHSPALVMARGEQLPFANASFDCVVATFPAPYILDSFTLSECNRVLGGTGQTLVVVGLWVRTTHPLLRWLPVFFGRPAQHSIERIQARLASSGFSADFREHADGHFHVGILVAQTRGIVPSARLDDGSA
jgi:SAM-dependent methyltransferase